MEPRRTSTRPRGVPSPLLQELMGPQAQRNRVGGKSGPGAVTSVCVCVCVCVCARVKPKRPFIIVSELQSFIRVQVCP